MLQISSQVVGVFQQYFAQHDPVQVAEYVHLRRNAANAYLHHRIGRPDRRRSLASSGVDRSTVQLLVMLPRASTFIVHLVGHMVRTPILPLSPGRPIFSLIRRNISSFGDEYFISLMYSCDVDIASTRRLASACRSLSHSTRGFLNVVGLSRF